MINLGQMRWLPPPRWLGRDPPPMTGGARWLRSPKKPHGTAGWRSPTENARSRNNIVLQSKCVTGTEYLCPKILIEASSSSFWGSF